jgi:hypothetical protein
MKKNLLPYILIILIFNTCKIKHNKPSSQDNVNNNAVQILEDSNFHSDEAIIHSVKEIIYNRRTYYNNDGFDYSLNSHVAVPIVVADLNEDGLKDALAIIDLENNSGGNTTFPNLAIFINKNNKIEHYKDLNSNFDLEFKLIDKVEVTEDGMLTIFGKGYKDEDAQCCPSKQVILHYNFDENKLYY